MLPKPVSSESSVVDYQVQTCIVVFVVVVLVTFVWFFLCFYCLAVAVDVVFKTKIDDPKMTH